MEHTEQVDLVVEEVVMEMDLEEVDLEMGKVEDY